MDKLEGTSKDLNKENFEKIKELFPNCITEGKINFDILKADLGDDVDEAKEKYQFTWNGKNKAIKIAQAPTSSTLRPCKTDSKNWNKTENIYIEGDNLEALKQLQKTYYGKIKVIYIDPPYNRGSDLIYKDNYFSSINNYKELTRQGMSSNPETSGRYHTEWLNMMFPRLMLARNLLKNDGAIFISIDDNELYNLKTICDEVFGEDNFVNCIVVKSSEATGVKMSHADKKMPKLKEYVLVYKKTDQMRLNYDEALIPIEEWGVNYKNVLTGVSRDQLNRIRELLSLDEINDDQLAEFDTLVKDLKMVSFPEAELKWYTMNEEERLNWKYKNAYRIVREVASSSAKQLADIKSNICDNDFFGVKTAQNKLYFIKNHYNKETKDPNIKLLFAIDYLMVNPCDFWQDIKTTRLDQEGGVAYNNGKKPIKLLNRLISLVSQDNDIILDFFSGSGTTAHATMALNEKQQLNRKWIMVQFPENLDVTYQNAIGKQKKDIKYLIDFLDGNGKPHLLTEIGKERIRISGEQIKKEWIDKNCGEGLFKEDKEFPYDIGFKVFKLDSTNVNQWDSEIAHETLTLENTQVFKNDRSKEDILYEIMLKYGIFDQKVKEENINGKIMYRVGERYMIVCLVDKIDEGDIKSICDIKPQVAVFKEEGFNNDNDKINAEFNLKNAGVLDIKCI